MNCFIKAQLTFIMFLLLVFVAVSPLIHGYVHEYCAAWLTIENRSPLGLTLFITDTLFVVLSVGILMFLMSPHKNNRNV